MSLTVCTISSQYRYIMHCVRLRPVPYPEVVSRQTDGENRVVVADHCIIHAHAMAPSSVRMLS